LEIYKTLPESLDARRERLFKDYSLTEYNVAVLMDEPGAVEYFEEASMLSIIIKHKLIMDALVFMIAFKRTRFWEGVKLVTFNFC
jgi:Asp-tRNA(Asn)/Glu-tRNA(Gln) amidotransferase B subunit